MLDAAGALGSLALVLEGEPGDEAIPKIEINRLSSIIVEGKEYIYLHDLEKAGKLCMDGCLSMISMKN